jgi:DNA-directed RNA polymerase specialized sigma24 family protein
MIKGEEMAFEQFSHDYIPILYRFAQRRLTGDQDLVADLVQTTICTARETNMADDEEVSSEASFRPVISGNPEQTMLSSEKANLVHLALDSLPPHYGRALEWKYLEDLPVKEIASRLEMSPKAAESLLTRARLSFREEYSRYSSDVRLSPDAV